MDKRGSNKLCQSLERAVLPYCKDIKAKKQQRKPRKPKTQKGTQKGSAQKGTQVKTINKKKQIVKIVGKKKNGRRQRN